MDHTATEKSTPPQSSEPLDESKNICRVIEPADLSEAQLEISRLILTMRDDITGYRSIDADGVWRSYDADSNVVDAVPLTPALIKALLDRTPYDKELESSLRGVDGTKVPKEQWLNPPAHLKPEPVKEEYRERDEEVLQKYRRMYAERRKQIEEGTIKICSVQLMSNNNVE